VAERFQAQGEVEVIPRFKIAPTQPVVTVRQEKAKPSRRFSTMRWGLIPSWAKDHCGRELPIENAQPRKPSDQLTNGYSGLGFP